MATANDIMRQVEAWTGHRLNRDEGVHHGAADRPLTGVTVSWMASPDAIRATAQSDHQLLLAHESLYYPYDVLHAPSPPVGWELWGVNRQHRELLATHGLTCLRIHGSADEICIFDTFAALLGLGDPIFAAGLLKVYEIPPCSLAELTEMVRERMHMRGVRVAGWGDGKRTVKRVGLPWGGLGLFVNVGYQQRLVEQQCDVFIAGESDSYGFRFAAESGIPMIETSHEGSENPGLRRFTQMLAEAFPAIAWRFHEEACIWRIE